MATPVGHTILGLAAARLAGGRHAECDRGCLLFVVFTANAPDLDFIPGLLIGDINLFHHGATHSFGAALVFGLATAIGARWFHLQAFRIAIMGTAAYVSHLLVDLFSEDSRAPFGLPLLWPFNDEHWAVPLALFSGVKHGVPGDDFQIFIKELFSWDNAVAVGTEILLLLPILLAVWYLTSAGPMFRPLGRGKRVERD